MQQYYSTFYDTCNVIECSTDGFITDINDSFLTLLKADKSEFIDKHAVEFFGEEEYNQVWANMEHGKPYDDVFTVDFGTGEITFRQKFLPICDSRGNVLRVILIATPENV
jgi:PAS domain-containing protein